MNIEVRRPNLADLERAISGLPDLQRRAFLLAARDDFPYSEIAAKLGISVRRLERLLLKALIAVDRNLS